MIIINQDSHVKHYAPPHAVAFVTWFVA